MTSLLIEGKIHNGHRIFEGFILIEDGFITKTGLSYQHVKAGDKIKLANHQIALPGLIDMHVHMRDFQLGYKEDFQTGTRAAAKGGFTVVADMPNTKPPVNTVNSLIERDRVARSKAVVDYGLYYGVSNELNDTVKKLVLGFKVYSHEDYYSPLKDLTLKTIKYASLNSMPVLVHAENPRLFENEVRPPSAEESAIRDFAFLSRSYSFHLHITHLSSAQGVQAVKEAKQLSTSITADTCPHYLLLSDEDYAKLGPIARVYPPLRSKQDREMVLKALAEQVIDAVSSDHAPHTLDEKLSSKPPGGFPGLETTLPLMTTLVSKGVLSLDQLVHLLAVNPSKILKLRKHGFLAEGFVGNVTIVDLSEEWAICSSEFESKAKYSPFDGFHVKGKAIATIVRGSVVMERGEVKVSGGGANVKSYN